MFERILLIGGPDTGKTHQLVNVAQYIAQFSQHMWVMDCEDKLGAFLESIEGPPTNLHLSVATSWEEMKDVVAAWEKQAAKIKGQWIAVDRVDLLWPAVQRWYTEMKYNEELADKMLKAAQSMKGSAMFTPRFDQGSWQVINEAYDSLILKLLLGFKSHVIFTAGVRGTRDGEISPFEVFGHLGVVPRGQKEIAHQPHSAFLLFNEYIKRDKLIVHKITTAKDLPRRERFNEEDLFDFAVQYLDGRVK